MRKILTFVFLVIMGFSQGINGKSDFKYLLWEKKTEFRKSGASFSTFHEVVKINTIKGARRFSVLSFSYDPATTGIKILHIKVIKKNGKQILINTKAVKDLPMPAGLIFWGQRHKVVEVKGLSPGDILDFKYRTWGFRIAYLDGSDEEKEIVPPLKGHFYDIVYFSSSYPVEIKRYILWGPVDVPLSFEVFNGNVKISKRIKGKFAYYTWEKRNIKPFKRHPFSPSFSDIAEKLIVTSLHDWRIKSRWFFKVSEPSLRPDENVRKLVHRLIKKAKNEEEKIFLLTHWVAQNVRYLGLRLGPEEGYTPHPAPYTLWTRGGVCKDKAALLTSMLRVAGLPAFQVMTEAGSRVENIVADQFNHSVTAIKTNKGYRLLDATWAPQSRELWSSREQLQDYLVGTPEGETLMRTPPFPAEKNYLIIKLKGRIVGNTLIGNLFVSADNHYDTSFRRRINTRPKEKRNTVFYSLIGDISPFAKIKSLKRSDTFDFKRPFSANIRFEAPNYYNGKILFPSLSSFPPSVFNEFLRVKISEGRTIPIRLSNNRRIIMEEEITLPNSVKIISTPKNMYEKSEDAVLEVKYFTSGRKIRVKYKLVIKNKLIKDIKGFNRILEALKKAQNNFYIVKGGIK